MLFFIREWRTHQGNQTRCRAQTAALGLPTATTDIASFGAETVLVVERFDRQWLDDPHRWIAHIPQEDICPALGVPPDDKYEAQGGPGMAPCLKCCAAARTAAADIRHFLCAQLAF